MSSTVISEAYLVIASVIALSLISGAVLLNLQEIRSAQVDSTRVLKDRIRVDVRIVFATSVQGSSTAYVWVKNVGAEGIASTLVPQGDLYFGPAGGARYVPYDETGSTAPSWSFRIVNDVDGDGRWDPGETIEIVVLWDSPLGAGDYYVRYSAYTGDYDEYYFSI